ncbi:MAG: hypothetical protein KAS32_29785 [Candidatus Peribacteraceae bacterium]|nr:hypothetical protein [Candidatus Peribacteraceae bacterium]
MTSKSTLRGHPIICIDDEWVYADTKTPTAGNYRPVCGKCGLDDTPEGHDGCLGKMPNVKMACCGHGEKQGWIEYWDGKRFQLEPTNVMELQEKLNEALEKLEAKG